ncbi:MAG: hypothetical protein BWY89_01734 [Bacteroidetes bacterium ADurb.BinA012]|nr:MAG: hypothetical protein BWY89_01734 [Bacteroidetes bacterium ADurb.BinA012]
MFPYREVRRGTSVRAARRLTSIEKIITPQNCLRMSETSVLVRAMGRNTITRTMVIETTVNPISLIASHEARTRFFPISICR